MLLIAILVGLIPSFAWLIFYLHEDFRHPEPRSLVALTFFVGAVSAILVLPFQIVFNQWIQKLAIGQFDLRTFLALAALEEIAKFFVVFLFIRKANAFTFEPIHPMIYMIVSALGFAALENIASLYNTHSEITRVFFESTILRFVGATLLHTLASGIVGYYWGKAFSEHGHYTTFIVFGIAIATVVHALFNYLVIQTGPLTYPIAFLIFISLFVLHDFELLKKFERR